MKTRNLQLFAERVIPLDMATETFGFLGRKGRGKTYGAQRWLELLYRAGVQCVVLDPVGNWWSLRVDADGKSPGLPIYVFGGPHGDVPLEPGAGAFIARVIVEKNISVVLDVSRFRKAERKRFMTSFAEEFFHLKKDAPSPVHLFIEEAHVFCPQKPREGEEQMLGAMEDVVRIGRNYGVGISLISQRAATVNKEVLSQVEGLVAYQTASAQDKKAIKEWIEENDEEGVALLGELKSLQRGEAIFWSPSVLRAFLKVHVTTKTTLDASSTPTVGAKARRPATLASVDLAKITESMKEVVENAEANNVVLLKQKVKKLELELAKKAVAAPAPAVAPGKAIKELVPLISHRQVQRIEKLATRITTDTDRLDAAREYFDKARDRLAQAQQAIVSELGNLKTMIGLEVKKIEATQRPTTTLPPELRAEAARLSMQQRPKIGAPPAIGAQRHPPVTKLLTSRASTSDDASMTPAKQRILDTIALLRRLGIEVSRDTLAAWYGRHPRDKAFVNNLGALRTAGYLDDFQLTGQGQVAAQEIDIPTLEHLHATLLAPLSPAQRRIVELLIEHGELEREALAEKLNRHARDKAFVNNVGALRSRHLVTKDWPMRASEVFYPQGL